jgi:hypothetical protein
VRFPLIVYFVAAVLIAAIAFAIGQVWPGMGVAFAAAASTAWTAYVVSRQQKWHKKNG